MPTQGSSLCEQPWAMSRNSLGVKANADFTNWERLNWKKHCFSEDSKAVAHPV